METTRVWLTGVPADAIPAEARRRGERGGGRGRRQAAALRRPRRAGLLPGDWRCALGAATVVKARVQVFTP